MIRKSKDPTFTSSAVQSAVYFGIEIEVLAQMEHCSLIQYGDLKIVVDTSDLVFARAMKTAA